MKINHNKLFRYLETKRTHIVENLFKTKQLNNEPATNFNNAQMLLIDEIITDIKMGDYMILTWFDRIKKWLPFGAIVIFMWLTPNLAQKIYIQLAQRLTEYRLENLLKMISGFSGALYMLALHIFYWYKKKPSGVVFVYSFLLLSMLYMLGIGLLPAEKLHLIIFSGLSFWAFGMFNKNMPRQFFVRLLKTIILLSFIIITKEIIETFTITRVGSIIDVKHDILAAFFGALMRESWDWV